MNFNPLQFLAWLSQRFVTLRKVTEPQVLQKLALRPFIASAAQQALTPTPLKHVSELPMFPDVFSFALTVLVALLYSRTVSVVRAADSMSMVEVVSMSCVEDVGTSSSIPSVLPFTEPAVRLKNLSMPVNDRDEGGMGKELMT